MSHSSRLLPVISPAARPPLAAAHLLLLTSALGSPSLRTLHQTALIDFSPELHACSWRVSACSMSLAAGSAEPPARAAATDGRERLALRDVLLCLLLHYHLLPPWKQLSWQQPSSSLLRICCCWSEPRKLQSRQNHLHWCFGCCSCCCCCCSRRRRPQGAEFPDGVSSESSVGSTHRRRDSRGRWRCCRPFFLVRPICPML